MKQIGAFWSILWRATLLFPLAMAFFVLAIAYLVMPPVYCLGLLFSEPFLGVAGFAAWGVSLYFFRRFLGRYFERPDSVL